MGLTPGASPGTIAPLALSVTRRAAGSAEIEAALQRLDQHEGIYFGCDAGIAGLHPLQAGLLSEPCLAFDLHADGLLIRSLSPLGAQWLALPALSRFVAASGRGRDPQAAWRALRLFHAALGHCREALLLGALRFRAWRLAAHTTTGARADDGECLGVLYFGPSHFQRDSSGNWWQVSLQTALAPAATGMDELPTPGVPPRDTHRDTDDFPPGGYARLVSQALQALREQALVSLTLSQSFRRPSAMRPSAGFARLRAVNPAPASFLVNSGAGGCFFGASPDLQLVVADGLVQSLPVCGTVPRGDGPVGEAQSFRELINEDVDAASLAVCTDALRNDLAPLCEPGSLQLLARRRQLSLATVVHTVDQLQGRLRPGHDAWDAIAATTAPVMVTGTPRALAVPLIEALEASPRGWYGGLVLRVGGDGSALAGTILRAACLADGVAEVRCGGDLLADSDPAREEQESRLKAVSLWRALGLEATPAGSGPTDAAAALPPVRWDAQGDPFAAATCDALLGLGLHLQDDAAVRLLSGTAAVADPHRLVAVGDAAARVLAAAGFVVNPIAPEHGRVMRCTPEPGGPLAPGPFHAARYATLSLNWEATAPAVRHAWQVWARDGDGQPVVLAHPQWHCVCLLWRPESLLSDARARQAWLRGLQRAAAE